MSRPTGWARTSLGDGGGLHPDALHLRAKHPPARELQRLNEGGVMAAPASQVSPQVSNDICELPGALCSSLPGTEIQLLLHFRLHYLMPSVSCHRPTLTWTYVEKGIPYPRRPQVTWNTAALFWWTRVTRGGHRDTLPQHGAQLSSLDVPFLKIGFL